MWHSPAVWSVTITNLIADVRYAIRVLRKSPAFAIVALITLTLGIGANVVVFGVLNAVVLRPLAVSDPHNLYQVRPQTRVSGRLLTSSYLAFEDVRRRNTTFSGMAAVNAYSHAELRWGNNAVLPVAGDSVSGNYFALLGVNAEAGRFFGDLDEHGANSAPYVVLSDDLWHRAFHGDRGFIGAVVELDKHPFTVVGIAPPQFHGTEQFAWPDYWLPLVNQEQLTGSDGLQDRSDTSVTVIGRLKPGVTQQQATNNLNVIATQLAREYPRTDKGMAVRLVHAGLRGDDGEAIQRFLFSVTLMALLVLAAACANLASLFAARAADRSRELALRMALGASRRRLMHPLLTEAMLVAMIGGGAGLLSACFLLGMLNGWRPEGSHIEVIVDARVYLAAAAFTMGSAMLFGLMPTRQAWRSNPLQMLKNGAGEAAQPRGFALRDLLLTTQIAICTLLITASLVAVRGALSALNGPIGIQPQSAMLAEVDLGDPSLTADAALEKQKAMLEAVRAMPGVSTAGMVDATPLGGGGSKGNPIYRQGTAEFTLDKAGLETRIYELSPGYLEAAGTRLLSGRDVSWHDTKKAPWVAIVNATFARKLWGDGPAVGQHFFINGNLTEAVGVVEDGKYHDLAESPQPVVYLPLSQNDYSEVTFVVRSRQSPNVLVPALRRTLSSVEPNATITLQSWTDALSDVVFPARAAAVALGVMGLLAVMLAVTGIFGMAAYNVSRRMKELGIRVALGARRLQVMRAAVGRPMVLLGLGSAVGLMGGLLARRLLERMVYQANPHDPLVLGGAILTMALVGMAASAIPARRALAIDPSKLMRED